MGFPSNTRHQLPEAAALNSSDLARLPTLPDYLTPSCSSKAAI
jgi:hypothetical protein